MAQYDVSHAFLYFGCGDFSVQISAGQKSRKTRQAGHACGKQDMLACPACSRLALGGWPGDDEFSAS